MIINFDTMKAIQAAAIIMKIHNNNKIGRMRLIKLLYIADRESIKETLHPITGDEVVAMTHGPVLSNIYRMIREKNPNWVKYIENEGDRDHILIKDPGEGKLSEYEVEKLQQVSLERKHIIQDYTIADETHKFEEWIKNEPPEGSQSSISFHDIIEALNLQQYKEKLLIEAEDDEEFEKLLNELKKGEAA